MAGTRLRNPRTREDKLKLWAQRHPLAPLAISCAALFVALGGGAYAISTKAPKDSVTSKSIVDGAVKSKDVKDNSLTGSDIDQSTLSGGGGSGGPPSGPAGGDLTGNYPKPQIAPGAVGTNALGSKAVTAGKLGDIIRVEDAGPSGFFRLAQCPPGTRLIGGGAIGFGPLVGSDGDYENNAWIAATENPDTNITVHADCLKQ